MLWVLVIPMVLGAPNGQPIEISGLSDPPTAWARQGDCEVVAHVLSNQQHRAIACKPLQIDGGKAQESF